MVELLRKFGCQQPAFKKINVGINPLHAYGLNFLHRTRIVAFKGSGGSHFIDFVQHAIEEDVFYVIPPYHVHHIHPDFIESDFLCIDVDTSLLNQYFKELLYRTKYNTLKSLRPGKEIPYNCSFKKLCMVAFSSFDEEELIANILHYFGNKDQDRNPPHITYADQFLEKLTQQPLYCNNSITDFSKEINLHERTLRRTCRNVFGNNTKDVYQYHFLLKSKCYLSEPHTSIAEVAARLGFAEVSSFSRYIKSATNLTPSQLRDQICEPKNIFLKYPRQSVQLFERC